MTMHTILFWTYFINGNLLISHEIDAAYWNEWKLFKLAGGITGFLIFNFIVIPPFLYGFAEIAQKTFAGLIFSLVMAAVGIFTFGIHMYFFTKGKTEFKVPMSIFILASTFVVSIIQAAVTVNLLINGY